MVSEISQNYMFYYSVKKKKTWDQLNNIFLWKKILMPTMTLRAGCLIVNMVHSLDWNIKEFWMVCGSNQYQNLKMYKTDVVTHIEVV